VGGQAVSAVPGKALGPAGLGFETHASNFLKAMFGLACVFYAVLAFDYFLSFGAGQEGLWIRLFAALVSREHAYGAGSVHVDQAVPYRESLNFLLMHTTMGAIAMALGPFQFSNRLRKRYPAVHRTAGKVYLVGAVLSMIGGLAYLSITPMQAVFSGAMFSVALAGLDVMVLLTAWLAYAAVRRRAFAEHRSWMAFNFGLLLATPVLRLLWICFGWAFPAQLQAATNLAITTFLLPLCITGMLWWVAAQNGNARPRPLRLSAAARARWRNGGRLALTAGIVVVGLVYVGRFALPGDAWPWFPSARTTTDAALFESAWVAFVLYALASAAAMTTSLNVVAAAVAGERVGRSFHLACVATAVSGAAFATVCGARLPGGWPVLFYWWALAGLWIFATAFAIRAARAGRSLVARDWTLYSAALAWLPLTVLPQAPLWAQLDVMDADTAMQTAVTLSFIGHYLFTHIVITRVLDRAPAPAHAAG